jgi:hypothetical protein
LKGESVTTAKWIWLLILALFCVTWGTSKAVAIKSDSTVDPATQIGWLKWEASECSSGMILASGEGPLLLRDLQVTERPLVSLPNLPIPSTMKDTRLVQKRIKLNDEFDFGMAEYPTPISGQKSGFGITATRKGTASFSWEWFTVSDINYAVKLQEKGELAINLKEVDGAWEVKRTEFLTDVSLRIMRMMVDPPGSPAYWRIKIFAGSNITWPSLINGEVVLN